MATLEIARCKARLKKAIKIVGARTHNLKGIDCKIPSRRITAVTGVSGSGKSSLVFDTLYAEGQRRYVQSLSTYARLFLEQMERPDVDSITDIPPAIALEQKNAIKNARSTVGTITEIHDYLRLLMTHAATVGCPDCGGEVRSDDVPSATEALLAWPEKTRAVFHTRVAFHGIAESEAVETLIRQGYTRVVVGGETVALEELPEGALLESAKRNGTKPGAAEPGSDGAADVVIDRFALAPDRRTRISEALQRGFHLGSGRVSVLESGGSLERTFDERFACVGCDKEVSRPTPHLFSFNSPLGACPVCEGFGRVVAIDPAKVVPNPRLSLRDGAVAPWSTPAYTDFQQDFLQAAERLGHSTQIPFSRLPEEAQQWVFEGDRNSPGVKGFFAWLEQRRYKTHVRILLARYRSYRTCESCGGRRLKPGALAARIGKRNISDFCALSIDELTRAMGRLKLGKSQAERTVSVMREIKNRLAYLNEVGLGYLTLDRQARTLSGGEAQRIHLAAALGSALTDTLYALDEPTVGLHPRDGRRLLKVLRHLTKKGNTVVLVEHDPTLITGADHVIDLGPGGGARGGEILYQGKPSGLPSEVSETGRLLLIRTLSRQRKIEKAREERVDKGSIVIRGAAENNLAIDSLEIPLGRFVCITGVSGSGKSTLVEQVLYENYLKARGLGGHEAGKCEGIDGLDAIDEILMMSQAPIGRSLRSNPATYLKFYDDIRKLFASTTAAKREAIKPGMFSFNTTGGRCERCQGTGTVTLEMHFMADIDVTCDECEGRRFKKRVLDIRYRDKDINDVLALTVDEAAEFFGDRAAIAGKLKSLGSVGLGYLSLGQSTSTLSGGEAQRLKLAGFLVDEKRAKAKLFIFDEPTTGLHLHDVHTLIDVLDGLIARGHSVVVVEHHTDFISHAHHVIDLGPEGGDGGGRIVVAGTPMDVAECEASHTGTELRELMGM